MTRASIDLDVFTLDSWTMAGDGRHSMSRRWDGYYRLRLTHRATGLSVVVSHNRWGNGIDRARYALDKRVRAYTVLGLLDEEGVAA